MLRPGEVLQVERRHLIFPDALPAGIPRTAFVVIEKPKTRKTAARRQHVRIRRGDVIDLLERRYGSLPPAARLWPYSPYQFSQRWDTLCVALGIPHKKSDLGLGFPPASLRPGGAAFLFAETDRIDCVHWRAGGSESKRSKTTCRSCPRSSFKQK